jgi:hypothetical protein
MARFVMISIPDNADANAFVKAIESDGVIFSVPTPDTETEVRYTELTAKVEAVWAQPTKFCDCPDYAGTSAPTSTYRWMVHAKCARPRKGAMQHPKDLLRPDAPATETPYYLGFRADSKGWRIPKEKP